MDNQQPNETHAEYLTQYDMDLYKNSIQLNNHKN